MASLRSITLQSPGTLGLNTQDQDNVQDPRYSTQALNCVISRNGLLEARKGAAATNTTAAFASPFDVVYSYVQDDGTETIISTGSFQIIKGTTGDLSAAGADITPAAAPTSDDWQFQTYAGNVIGYAAGEDPIIWDGGAGDFTLLSAEATAANIVQSHCHLSAFGRSWVVDTTTVSQINYSDLLDYPDFTNGSAGSIDLNTVWPYSNDTITCLAAHNNNLIIFCEKSIIIYGNANDINNLFLVEVIKDIGCVARDSVQNIGDDIFFLANDGVRSLARTILQDNMPQKEISAPIRDDLVDTINSATLTSVRSTYNEKEGFYLITFPELSIVYCCDVRLASQSVFRWTTFNSTWYGLETSKAATDELLIGLAAGWIAEYSNYSDTDTSDGGVDASYVMKFRSGWIDTGLQTSKAIWKRMATYIASLANISATMSWAFDFSETEYSLSKGITGAAPPVYGTSVYGTDAYGGQYEKNRIPYAMKGTGSIIKVGFQSVVDGGKFAFNKVDLFFKAGRIR